MRNGCLPNLGSIYLWKRNSKKEEKRIAKANEVSKLIDSAAANKDDSLAFAETLRVLNVIKDEKLDEKITAEQGLESVDDVSRTQAEQDLAQHQAKTIRVCAVSKFGDWSNESASGDGFSISVGERWPHNELNKLKTFGSRGFKSSRREIREAHAKEFNKVKTLHSTGVESSGKEREANAKEISNVRSFHVKRVEIGKKGREDIANEFQKVKTFDFIGVKKCAKEREDIANEFHKVKTFDLKGVKSSG